MRADELVYKATIVSQCSLTNSLLTYVQQVHSSGSVVCDTIIACSMSYHIWKARTIIRGNVTTTLITRILRLTVETGVICTVVVTTFLVLFVISSASGGAWYTAPALAMSKFYSVSLLAVWSRCVYFEQWLIS